MLQWRKSQAAAQSWWYSRWEGPGINNIYGLPAARPAKHLFRARQTATGNAFKWTGISGGEHTCNCTISLCDEFIFRWYFRGWTYMQLYHKFVWWVHIQMIFQILNLPGFKTLAIKEQDKSRIMWAEVKCIRGTVKYTWQDCKTNEDILSELKNQPSCKENSECSVNGQRPHT